MTVRRSGSTNPRVILGCRDLKLLEEIALNRLMSRDQIIALGYFDSISRCNYRLSQLVEAGFLYRQSPLPELTGFQSTYMATRLAVQRLMAAGMPSARGGGASQPLSPLLVRHTLAVTNVRLAALSAAKCLGLALSRWLPEVLCRHEFSVRRGSGEWQRRTLRPDGYFELASRGEKAAVFLEVDLGHVSSEKFGQKMGCYDLYRDGIFERTYGLERFTVLTLTTGTGRKSHLVHLAAKAKASYVFLTFDELRDPTWISRFLPTGKETQR